MKRMIICAAAAIAGDKIFDTAGYDNPDIIRFHPGPTSCGDIKDGVSLEHGTEGSWVLAFKDLETMYKLAAKARGLPDYEQKWNELVETTGARIAQAEREKG